MNSYLFSFILSLFFLTAAAQKKQLPAEAVPFIPNGYEMLDYVKGDLNGDKKEDAILILKKAGESDDDARPFLILTRQNNGKLIPEKRNDSLVMCRECGGIFGDPYENTEISNNAFTINFYGGSSWRWGYNYRFEYKPAKKNWYLVNEKQLSYHNTEPEVNEKRVSIDEAELGEIAIDNYVSNSYTDLGEWKVIAAKTFFYNNPKKGSQPRKAYLMKGDRVNASRLLTNFMEVSFANKNGKYTYGFILKKDLVKEN